MEDADQTVVDPYEEFFSKHYNGSEMWCFFTLRRMSWAEVRKYKSSIRIGSYRW